MAAHTAQRCLNHHQRKSTMYTCEREDQIDSAIDAAIAAAYQEAAAEIRNTFETVLLHVPTDRITLPQVTANGKLIDAPMTECITEALGDSEVDKVLMQVLTSSACPLVAKLRRTMAQSYIDAHGPKLAQVL